MTDCQSSCDAPQVLAVHKALVKGGYIGDAESIEKSSTSGMLGDVRDQIDAPSNANGTLLPRLVMLCCEIWWNEEFFPKLRSLAVNRV